MSEKYLSSSEYVLLRESFPALFDEINRGKLIDVIGSYPSKVLALLPDELCPEFTSNAPEVLREHSEYVGRKVSALLRLGAKDIMTEKQLGMFFLSEILWNHSDMKIWRSHDNEQVFEYSLQQHGDTVVQCTQSDTGVQGYLSFSQSVYPLIISLLLYIQSIDPTGENTLGKWDWQKSFFSRGNFWKGGITLLPYEERGMDHYLGDVLFDKVPTQIKNELYFTLKNGQACFPVLDNAKKQLTFYVQNPEGMTQIGRLGLFKNDFIIKEADIENMFSALCQLVARDPSEILQGIMRYFPKYYKTLLEPRTAK